MLVYSIEEPSNTCSCCCVGQVTDDSGVCPTCWDEMSQLWGEQHYAS